ncbi:neuronal acetylcholine receptor subunit alpha-2-like isoform X1 [Photinus pyralis]|nr:neuronal acetylcholine receptor subunit alpha-2-like isoform X1 [Photinus pyralis]
MRSNIVLLLIFISNFADSVFFDNFTFDHMIAIESGKVQLWNETDQDKLKKDLFVNYDRFSRPTEHFNTTKVNLGVSILHLETDERRSTVTVHAWMRMVWYDQKLKWKEEDYGKIFVLRIADHELWHPDLYLYNSASGGEPLLRFGGSHALVYPNGEVLHVPPLKQTVLCEFDLRNWPFDTQSCELKYGSWVHHGQEVELALYNNEARIDLSDLLLHNSWKIIDTGAAITSTKYVCCPEPYYDIKFTFRIARNPNPYSSVVIAPSIVNALLVLAQFSLPNGSKQRLYLNGFLLLILASYLLYFLCLFSGTGRGAPLIVQFYVCSLYTVCFGLLSETTVTVISRSKKLKVIESTARKVFAGMVARVLLIESDVPPVSKEALMRNDLDDVDHEEIKLGEYMVRNVPFLSVLVSRLFFILYLSAIIAIGLQFRLD